MGINGIGNPYNQSSVYGKGELESSTTLVRENNEAIQQGNVVVTEARARVSFAVATPQLADAMNLTSDERQEFIRSFEEKAASATVNLGHKSVMLDIYAVMELIREMGQKLRNAMREMRQCQNQAIQQNLKAQAEMQRATALYQMVASAAVCLVQGAMSFKGMKDQIKGLTKQTKLGNQLGADVANKQLKMAEVGGRQDLAQNQLNNVMKEAPAGFKNDGPMLKSEMRKIAQTCEIPEDVANAQKNVGEKQDALAKLEEQKIACEQDIASGTLTGEAVESRKSEINDLNVKIDAAKGELVEAVKDYDKLVGIDPELAQEQVNKFDEAVKKDQNLTDALKNQKDLESRHEQERDDLSDSLAPLWDEDTYSDLDVKQADEKKGAQKRVADAHEKAVQGASIAKYEESPKGQTQIQKKYHEAMLSEVEGYKKAYEDALGRSNGEKRINGKVSDKTKAELKKAEYSYNLARAEQVYHSSTLNRLPPEAHRQVANNLMADLVGINNRVSADLKTSGVEEKAARGMFWQGMANAVGTLLQKGVESWGQIQQSHITEKQADEKMLEEQLDQLKELFNQVMSLIQKATELFQSVTSKESQSLEEIINALRA